MAKKAVKKKARVVKKAAPKRKAAVKKKAAPKRKVVAKKKVATKKKAAVKKKAAPKKTATVKKKAAPKTKVPKKAKTKRTSKLMQQKYDVSADLQVIVGGKSMTRPQIVKKLWEYIKAKKCQDTKNRRMINPDNNLSKVIGSRPVDMLKLAGLLSKHIG